MRKRRASGLTYRGALSILKQRDPDTGLRLTDRCFFPERETRRLRWMEFLLDLMLLSSIAEGLLLLTLNELLLPCEKWLPLSVLLVCVSAVFVSGNEMCRRLILWIGATLLMAAIAALYIWQDSFLAGIQQIAGRFLTEINERFNGDAVISAMEPRSGDVSAALFFLSAALVYWIAASLLWWNTFLTTAIVLLPVILCLLLCGETDELPAMTLISAGIMLGMIYIRPSKQNRMWGRSDSRLYARNTARFYNVRRVSAMFMIPLAVCAAVLCFVLTLILVPDSFLTAENAALSLQESVIEELRRFIPDLTAGQWNIDVEAAGGGVLDGSLTGSGGYVLENVDDLLVTVSRKPQETIYLRGYIGSEYQNGSWNTRAENIFDGAAMNWNVDGSARLYIQNLPFLRVLYSISQADEDDEIRSLLTNMNLEPVQMSVERLGANESYTYVPYGVFLNDYYQINGGDAAVAGQSVQEDSYYFFYRSDMENVLSLWNSIEDTGNVLDRSEESYYAFCCAGYLQTGEVFEIFRDIVNEVRSDNRWTVDNNLDDITTWIRQYLHENYSYNLLPAEPPDGEDALSWFLTENQEGSSIHFASAAVGLYRLFGIPARYVVGYEIPAAIFAAQSDGTYTALVQGDNSQAWAEIYVSGIGWVPQDMTPGITGTLEEIGPGGEKIEVVSADAFDDTVSLPEEDTQASEISAEAALTEGSGTLKEISLFFAFAAAACLCAAVLKMMWDSGTDPLRLQKPEKRYLASFSALFALMRRRGLPEDINSQSDLFWQFLLQDLRMRANIETTELENLRYRLNYCFYANAEITETDVSAVRRIYFAALKRKLRTR